MRTSQRRMESATHEPARGSLAPPDGCSAGASGIVAGSMTGALVVFCVTYLVIASRQLHFLKLDRPAGATVGAVAMVVVGGI